MIIHRQSCARMAWLRAFLVAATVTGSSAQPTNSPLAEPRSIDLDELMEMKVTSVGRKAEPRFYVPSAIEVLTQDDIRRYGALTIQDTLRMMPALHVARYSGSSYAITARGFSSAAGNKMQVLMDGRSLYTPLFSGVFWDVQDALLADLDRIEAIRGPGATLWGANAMNGVINIVSRDARQTQGTLLEAGGGNEELGFGAVRYGGKAGESTYFRVYSKYRYRDEQIFSTGEDAEDFSEHWQSGFRADSFLAEDTQLTLQGDLYFTDSGLVARSDSNNQGGNVLGRWTRTFSESSDIQFQLYYDRSDRDVPLQFEEVRDTIDFDFQNRFGLGERNDLVWGGNYRASWDDTGGLGTFKFDPPERRIDLVSGFVQDEITLVPERLLFTLGTKIEYNDFTGVEVQPSGRLAWIPSDKQVVWGAVSRAVRTPTRIETDLRFSPVPNGSFVTIRGNTEFDSEDMVAYELGYRVRPWSQLALEVNTFYNVYDNLRTLEPSATGIPLTLGNERFGETYGFSISIRYRPSDLWEMTASHALIEEDLEFTERSRDPTGGTTEANDPQQVTRLISRFTLPHRIEFDQVLRYVDSLHRPAIPGYVELDLRLAWRPIPGLELSITGMNLLDRAHPEFNGGSAVQPEVERSVHGKILWLF